VLNQTKGEVIHFINYYKSELTKQNVYPFLFTSIFLVNTTDLIYGALNFSYL